MLLLIGALVQGTAAPADTTVRRAAVTAVNLGMVYFAAGRNDGVREGLVVTVPRLGSAARYRVAFISSRSAAARAEADAPMPVPGDSVVFTPVTAPETGTAAAGPSRAPHARTGPRLRGRIGVRYLGSSDRASGVTMRQPGLELRLDGPLAANAPVAITADLRSRQRRIYRAGEETASDGTVSIYQANLRVQSARGPVRLLLGRQYAPTLAGIGMFDGLLVDYQRPTFGFGVMGGLEPEPGSLALSSEIRQYGAFVQVRASPVRPVRWGLTAGAMGSYAAGGVNREFGFLQATLISRPVTAVLMQELDYNRDWKRAAGEPALSLTSSYASVNIRGGDVLTLNMGVDNRRTVRLYRDLLTPEDEFDDRFRLGMWGGASLSLIGNRLRVGGDVRTSTVGGTDSLRTQAVSGNVVLDRVTPLGLGARLRATRYHTPGREPGTLIASSIRLAPASFGAFELTAGSRREDGAPEANRHWLQADAELFVRRSWFLLASFTREAGRDGLTPTTELVHAGLSYRF